jgi:hypothetical protein
MAEYIVDRNGCSDRSDEHTAHVHVDRPIYTQQDFNQKYGIDKSLKDSDQPTEKAFLGGLRRRIHNHGFPVSAQCVKNTALSFFPCIQIMREYSIRRDLPSDIMSGIIVGIMHIPQGWLKCEFYYRQACIFLKATMSVREVVGIQLFANRCNISFICSLR